MKRPVLFSFIFTLFAAFASAQLSPTWNAEYAGNLNFQQVTATGTYLVGTSAGLSAYDPDNGNVLWTNAAFAGISADQLEEVSGSPLLLIRSEAAVSILDPFDGSTKFSSAEAGFDELTFNRLMYRTNGLLVSGKKGEKDAMVLVDLASGEPRWEIDEKFGKIVTAQEFSDSEMLVVALFNSYRMNSSDGSIIWKEATSAEAAQMQDAGALGALMQGMAESVAANMDFVIAYHEHPEKDIFVIASEVEQKVQSMSSDDVTIVYKNNYTAFDMNDGKRLWNQSVEMDGKLGDLAFYGEGAIILPDDGNKTLINHYPFGSGEGQWGKKGRGIKIKGGVYDYIETKQGLLLIAGSSDKTYLSFLDPGAGLLTFDKPVKVGGRVARTWDSDKGLAFVTSEEFDILNTASGELVLDKSIDTHPGLVAQKGDDLYLFDTKSGVIKTVNLNTAETKELTADKLKFDGGEDPQKIELRDNGILLTSEQNLALYDFSGALQYQQYYKAPTEPGLKKVLLVAQAVRAAYISANAYAASGTLQAAAPEIAEEDAVSGALAEGFGQMYQELGNAASDFAKESLQRATARFKATAEARDFMVILAKAEKGNALLKVNKNTGAVDAEIDLGKEKDPKYAVDDVLGKIFKQADGRQIACYDL